MIPRRPFRDPALHEEFERRGYVVVPLLTSSEVVSLQAAYATHAPTDAKGHHCTLLLDNPLHRWHAACAIRSIVVPRLAEWLDDYRAPLCNFMVKEPDPTSALQLHVDWSLVDERRFTSVHCWCPLVDVDEQNGCLLVVPGSHRVADPIRSYHCDFAFESVSTLIRERLLQAVPMSAGQAMLFHSGLIHASGANAGGATRVAMMCINVAREAPSFYWHRVSNEELDRYEADDEFFYQLSMGNPPRDDARPLGRDRLLVRQRSADDLLAACAPEPTAAVNASITASA